MLPLFHKYDDFHGLKEIKYKACIRFGGKYYLTSKSYSLSYVPGISNNIAEKTSNLKVLLFFKVI